MNLKFRIFKSITVNIFGNLFIYQWGSGAWTEKHLQWKFKDDFQSVLRSLRTLMFVNIINGSLDGMRIDVIR